jgi:hypothetical protein
VLRELYLSSLQVSKLLKQKEASFEHNNIYRVSVAAAPLAAWVSNTNLPVLLQRAPYCVTETTLAMPYQRWFCMHSIGRRPLTAVTSNSVV